MVYAQNLKFCGLISLVGSNPTRSTIKQGIFIKETIMYITNQFSLDMIDLDSSDAISANIQPISTDRARVIAPDCISIINNPFSDGYFRQALGVNIKAFSATNNAPLLKAGDSCLFGRTDYSSSQLQIKWFLVFIDETIDDGSVYADHDNDEV